MSIQWKITEYFLFSWTKIFKYVFHGTIRNWKDQADVCNGPGKNSVYLQSKGFLLDNMKTVAFETCQSKSFRTAMQLFNWKTNRARNSMNPLGMNDRFCTYVSDTETDHKVWMAPGTFSLYLVCLLASAAREVFHRRANVTENVSFSNTNGLPIKILMVCQLKCMSPYIFLYFYILSLSQLQSLYVFGYVLTPLIFVRKLSN